MSDTASPSPSPVAARRPAFVRFAVRAGSALAGELVSVAALEAGASGIEEGAEQGGIQNLWVYTDTRRAPGVRAALSALSGMGVTLGEPEPVADTDWSEAWREGMRALEISPRLVVTPSFLVPAKRPGQVVVTIDPGQAFGTGGHASTRLALRLLAALPEDRIRNAHVLDVGTGSGVLALAALALGAGRATGFDLDPLAAPAARENAQRNALAARLRVFSGPIAAIGPAVRFELVVANLLRSELLPIADAVAARVAVGGSLLLAGLLVGERSEVLACIVALGLDLAEECAEIDGTGDHWLGLRLTRRAERANR